MLKKIEEFLFGKVFGRIVARVAVGVGAYVAAQASGVGVHVDAGEISAAVIIGANALYSYLKDWRDKRAAAAAK